MQMYMCGIKLKYLWDLSKKRISYGLYGSILATSKLGDHGKYKLNKLLGL